MSYVPLSFFSRVVKPGDSIEVELDEASALITSVTYGESVKGDKRSALSLTYLDRMAEPEEEIEAGAAEEKDDEDEDDDSDVSFETGAVMRKTVIASLIPGKIENAAIHVVLNSNEAYELSVTGDNEVHLTGQYVFFPNDGPAEDSDSEEEYDSELDSDEFGEYDPETGMLGGEITGLTDGEDDEDSEDEDLEEDDSRFEELKDESPKKASAAKSLAKSEKAEAAKSAKAASKTEAAAEDVSMDAADVSTLSADTSKLSKNQKKKLKKLEKQQEAKAPEPAAAPAPAEPKKQPEAEKEPVKKPSKKQTLPSGLVIEDAKLGKGPTPKKGQMLSMRYIGKLANGKIFDQNTKGQPFKFKFGVGEVIKGWDEGMKGMAVGGERKLTIPAALAYGKKGVDGIPGGATLHFDVKLVGIK